MSLILTAAELEHYTKRDRPTAQARVLKAMGVPFAVHPFDGTLQVDREAARAALGVKVENESKVPAEVNLIALENYGKKRAA